MERREFEKPEKYKVLITTTVLSINATATATSIVGFADREAAITAVEIVSKKTASNPMQCNQTAVALFKH